MYNNNTYIIQCTTVNVCSRACLQTLSSHQSPPNKKPVSPFRERAVLPPTIPQSLFTSHIYLQLWSSAEATLVLRRRRNNYWTGLFFAVQVALRSRWAMEVSEERSTVHSALLSPADFSPLCVFSPLCKLHWAEQWDGVEEGHCPLLSPVDWITLHSLFFTQPFWSKLRYLLVIDT